MQRLSISRAWDEAKSLLQRNLRLLVPVVLAFGVLPGTLFGTLVPNPQPEQQGSPGLLIGLLVVAFLTYLGVVTVQRISLQSGEKVSEAVQRSTGPTFKVLAATVLLSIPMAILIAPFLPALVAGSEQEKATAAGAIFLVLLVALLPLARTLLAFPVAANERQGVFGMLARSWRLTRGNTLKLYGLSLIFLLVLALVSLAATRAVGTIVLLVAGPPEPLSVSALLLALSGQLAQSVVALPFSVLIAALYRQAVHAEETPASVPHAP